jgi:type II secretion system protein N
MKLKHFKAIAGYALFALAVLGVFLYLRFPGREMARIFTSSLAELNPRAVLVIGAVKPAFPPGLDMEKIVLQAGDHPAALFQADSMNVKPEYVSLLKGQTILLMTAKGYGGTLKGRLNSDRFLSLPEPVNARVDLDAIDIERSGYLKEQLGRQVTGKLKGTLNFSGSLKDVQGGSGVMEFTLINGSYPLRESLMGMDRLDFRRVDAQLNLKNGVLTVSRMKLAGDRISGSLSGDIALNRQDIKGSQINLTGSFEMAGQGGQKISLSLGGTIGNPAVKFM